MNHKLLTFFYFILEFPFYCVELLDFNDSKYFILRSRFKISTILKIQARKRKLFSMILQQIGYYNQKVEIINSIKCSST